MNIIDFINQKDKFKIQNIFDEKGTKNFLLSKEKALMEIQLNDDNSDKISNNSNNNSLKEEKPKIKKNKTKKNSIDNSKQASPRKKKGKSEKNKDLKKVKTEKCAKIKNNKYFSKIEQNDSTDDHLYKFIINNADESEDIFMKKLSKEIKIVENNKNKEKDKINKKIYKSVTNDKNSLQKKNQLLNPFYFSETAKKLMVNENIEISNIKDNTIIPSKTPINTNPTSYTSNKNESNKKNIFTEQETLVKYNDNKNIDMNDKISLMSILSDLM